MIIAHVIIIIFCCYHFFDSLLMGNV